jgi:hypothetical protein
VRGSLAPVAAIISGTTSGRRTSGPSRSRAREWTAIEEIRVPVAAMPRSARRRTAASGPSAAAESRKKKAKTGTTTSSTATR